MAGYIRQSSFSDGDTITAALFNNEYNQILNAFSNTSGHAHDGTTAEGPVIGLIGDAGETSPNNKVLIDTSNNYIEFYVEVSSSSVQQLYIADGAIVPVTDNDIDLGTSSLEFKDGYFDGTLYADAINFNGTAITATAAELNILDGVTASATDINLIDGITNGTVIASKAIITDANKDITGGRNITISGELDAATLDISGDADIDGTLEADAITIAGVTLAETISDTVGAMVGSNTETGISVTYDDSDNTLDFVIGADSIVSSMLDTNIDIAGTLDVTGVLTADTNATVAGTLGVAGGSTNGVAISQGAIAIKNGGTQSYVDFYCESSNAHYTRLQAAAHSAYSGNVTATLPVTTGTLAITSEIPTTEQIQDIVGAMVSSNTETNITITYQDSDGTLDFVVDAAQPNVTSLGTLTSLTVDDVVVDGAVIGHTSDTDLITLSSGVVTVAGEVDATSLDISGDADIDGTLEADAITIGGVTLAETIADTVGAMVTSNTESGITVAYQDADNTLDFTVGTLNQDTTGTADNITVSANNSADETVYPIFVDGATGSQGAESDTGLTYNPSSGNLTIGGSLTAATLDISGDVDVDGTLEADAITVNGTTLAETISDTVGAMVGSNTETGITVTYEDGDNTLDFALGAAQTTIPSLLATDIKIGEDDQTKIDFETADEIHFYAANVEQVYLGDNIFGPQSDSDVDLGTTGVRWKDAYVDSITVTGEVDAASLDISGNIDVDGTANLDNTDIDGTLNVSGVVTAQTSANLNEVALTDGTVSWDAAAAANATLLLEENSTISAPDNPVAGAIISIEVAQHASSGPYTLAWNSVFQFAGGTTPTMTATDAKTDIYTFRYNGSKWQNIGVTQNLTQS